MNKSDKINMNKQVKQERALQEQASTYLQLVCSACDLSEPRVRETAGAIQQVKLRVSSNSRQRISVFIFTLVVHVVEN